MSWEPHCNGGGQRPYFLSRPVENGVEYHWSRNGSLIRYANYTSAQEAADRLNAESARRRVGS